MIANLGLNLSPEEVEEMVCQADIDGDGTIDYAEFVKMMTI